MGENTAGRIVDLRVRVERLIERLDGQAKLGRGFDWERAEMDRSYLNDARVALGLAGRSDLDEVERRWVLQRVSEIVDKREIEARQAA